MGSFGVAVGTAEQELYKIEGPVLGYQENLNSFRGEAYGMLAKPNRKIHVYCDNLSLVRIMMRLRMKQINPRIFLRYEADVLLQISHEIKTLESLQFNVIIDHMKGHQDDFLPYHELSREAQLNVNADTYATNYFLIGDTPTYDILPVNPANLYINHHIITREVKNEMRKSAQSPDLRIYMNRKFDWDDTIADLIWWSIHGSTILSSSAADRRRIRKFIFRWLPTCERLKKYTELFVQCPSCNVCTETHRHLHQCTNTPRINFIETWMESFDTFLSNERITPPIIRQLFLYHLNIIFTPSDPGIIPVLTPEIQQASYDQERIGWYHLLCGRLAFRWGTIIAYYPDLHNIGDKKMTVLRWGRKFNRYVFTLTLSIWKQRNLDGHTLTPLKESALTRERLLLHIQAIQDSNPEVAYQNRDFVFRSIDTITT